MTLKTYCSLTINDSFFILLAISSGVLSRLDPKKAEYKRAHKQFTSTWVKYHPVPEPAAIYAVSNHSVWEAFQKYIKRLRANDSDATTDYYFHGTTLQCDILSTDSCCSDVNCGICGIVTRGFDKRLIGKNIPRFKRYGDAFYLAPNSSKCHDYTQGIESVGMRAQLLCVVACGTKFETKRDHTHFKTAPQYSDSVYGQSGGTLNYEEVAVYESQAILPEFVIVYNKNGVHKIAV